MSRLHIPTERDMAQASRGDTVRVHYTGTLDDGTEFDSSRGRDPLVFELGSGQVIPGFDSAVEGLSPGEETEVRLEAREAYGDRQEELLMSVDRDDVPPSFEPVVGAVVELSHPGGQRFPGRITEVSDQSIAIDANHPLAGQALTFAIELVEIV